MQDTPRTPSPSNPAVTERGFSASAIAAMFVHQTVALKDGIEAATFVSAGHRYSYRRVDRP